VTSTTDFDAVQTRIRVRFHDLSVLRRALTHRSYLNEHPDEILEDNERLEFLGDAVLDFVAGDWLYDRFPEMREGRLTRLRAALVRTETLADFGRQYGLGEALFLGRGEDESGGRVRQANLCRTFEALIGAIYLDQGLETVRQFVLPCFEQALKTILAADSDKDAKSLLQEWSQAHLNLTPIYRTVCAVGPDHAKEFTVEVVIGERVYGHGTGHSKQAAAQDAAQTVLTGLQDVADLDDWPSE
jgi:ribonuclease-3